MISELVTDIGKSLAEAATIEFLAIVLFSACVWVWCEIGDNDLLVSQLLGHW